MDSLTQQLAMGDDLDPSQIRQACESLLDESVEVDPKVAFLTALHQKGEKTEEIVEFVKVFLGYARQPEVNVSDLPGPMIDVCGTGGDRLNLFNVSTTCAFILAAEGLTVVKHGNRGVTSRSGGADVLEALGIAIDRSLESQGKCLREVGIGFLFAPLYHPAFKAVAPARKILADKGQRTIFNILGPLLNPLQPDYQLIGAFDEALLPLFIDILRRLDRTASWAVHGKTEDGRGVDELSTMGLSEIYRIVDGQIKGFAVHPNDCGIELATLESLTGGDPTENAAILTGILSGTIQGPKRDLVLLNAAAGLVVANRVADLKEGVGRAAELIDSGAAEKKLRALREFPI